MEYCTLNKVPLNDSPCYLSLPNEPFFLGGFDFGVARQRAARVQTQPLGSFDLGGTIIANTLIDDNARRFLGEHLSCPVIIACWFSWHGPRKDARFVPRHRLRRCRQYRQRH